MRLRICGSLLLAAACLISTAGAMQALPAAATSAPAPPGAVLLLPANAVVELEMVDAVASNTSKHGDLFRMRVATPVESQGQVLVPVGTAAVGQVVHAQKAGGGGKGGELILAARYLELPQGQVKLRSNFGAAGADRTRSSLALSLAIGPLAMVVKGKNVAMPAGAPLSARVAAETRIFPAPATAGVTTSNP